MYPEKKPKPEEAVPPSAATVAASAPRNAASRVEVFAMVAAPTTVITALAFFFGWTYTDARTSYFGVDPSTLGFSTQDYLLRSADALFVPLGTIVVLALAAAVVHANVTRTLDDPARRPVLRRASHAAVILGSILFCLGVVAAFEPLPFSPHYLFAPASPGVGIALLAYGFYALGRLNGPAPASRWRPEIVTLVALLVVLSGFWTIAEYAAALGQGRAEQLETTIASRPRVEVFAPKRLHIAGDGVIEHPLSRADSAYRYRYSGLRLLIRSSGKYFLLPEDWSRETGAAIVLSDTPELRFTFGPGE